MVDVRLIPYAVKQRLNKKDSSDYSNLQCYEIVEAYNKAQLEWCRRQLHGGNMYQEGAESTITRVDDLQILLTPVEILGTNRDYYFLSNQLPPDYFRYNAIRVWASKENCSKAAVKSVLREEANAEDLLRDRNSKPDFSWRETFHTIMGNRIKVYTGGDFTVDRIDLVYYRLPREIRIVGCDYLGTPSPENVDPEFNLSVVQLIIDDTASILAGDMESINQFQITSQRSEKNN